MKSGATFGRKGGEMSETRKPEETDVEAQESAEAEEADVEAHALDLDAAAAAERARLDQLDEDALA
jgi:hypothetical protein